MKGAIIWALSNLSQKDQMSHPGIVPLQLGGELENYIDKRHAKRASLMDAHDMHGKWATQNSSSGLQITLDVYKVHCYTSVILTQTDSNTHIVQIYTYVYMLDICHTWMTYYLLYTVRSTPLRSSESRRL